MIRRALSGVLRPLSSFRARHGRRITWVAVAVAAAIVVVVRLSSSPPSDAGNGSLPPPAASAHVPVSRSPSTGPDPYGASTRPAPAQTSSAVAHDDGLDGIDEFPLGPSASSNTAASTVVVRFAAAWIQRDRPAPRWWAGVAPFCENSYAEQLRTVDPGRVPAAKIIGGPRQLRLHSAYAVYDVATDAGTLQVTVAVVDGRWRVTDTGWRRRP